MVIGRPAIESIGASTVQDVLLKLPSNFAGVNENINNQGATGGTNRVSLRGLGAESTLVLINGRRVASAAAAGAVSFVNINSIPLAAIESIEVLPDGASAIYGSDAIGGVVNVKLRKDYQGVESTVRYGNTFEKDVSERRFSFLSGASTGKASGMVIFDYFSRNSMLRNEREFAASADQSKRHGDGIDFRSPTGNPGTVYLRPGSAYFTATNPLGLPANPSGVFGIPDGSTGVWTNAGAFARTLLPGVERTFDFAGPNQIIPESKRLGFTAISSYHITDKVEAFSEVMYTRTETTVYLAATPVSALSATQVIPASNPYNPFGEDVNFRFRPLDVGPRTDFIQTDTYRILGGLRGEVYNWKWEFGYMLNSDKVADLGSNYIVTSDVIAAASGTLSKAPGKFLNVFGDKQGNDPALLKALSNTTTLNGEITQQSYDGSITGTLFEIPAGDIGVAFGGEQRREKLRSVLDPLTQSGAFAGSGTRENTNGSRVVTSGYAEISVPLVTPRWNIPFLSSAELQVAGRSEHYDTAGGSKVDSNKPKYAISIKPIRDLVLRGSYSEGFRAPSLFELFSGSNGSFPSANDPLRSRLDGTITGDLVNTLRYWVPSTPSTGSITLAGTGLAADDNQQIQQSQQGNTNLKPEEAKSYYAGIVYSPRALKGFSTSAGWFNIKHENIIRLPSLTNILRDPALQALVRRDAPSAADIAAGRPGRLAQSSVAVFQQYVNLAVVEVEGYDGEIEYEFPTTSFGKFTTRLAGTYMAHFYDQTTVTSTKSDNVASGYSSQGTIPRVKANFSTIWRWKSFGTTVWANYSGKYDDISDRTGLEREIEPYTTFDVQAFYDFKLPFIKGNTRLTAGVYNVADETPPFVSANFINGSGNSAYDPYIVDPRGRFFYLELRQQF